MQLVVKSLPEWVTRFQPVNHVARGLATLMRVEHFTYASLNQWLRMGGTVILNGKPYIGEDK